MLCLTCGRAAVHDMTRKRSSGCVRCCYVRCRRYDERLLLAWPCRPLSTSRTQDRFVSLSVVSFASVHHIRVPVLFRADCHSGLRFVSYVVDNIHRLLMPRNQGNDTGAGL